MTTPILSGEDGAATTSSRDSHLRSISLTSLLSWHGMEPKREGVSFRAKTDRHNIVVTGSLWYDNKAGIGGAGVIDLQMHLSGENFPTACKTLSGQFLLSPDKRGSQDKQRITLPPGHSAPSERIPFPELMAKYAVRDDGNWPIARTYLIETRGIEPAIVEELHATGSIYANDHTPNPALVFLHRTPFGKVIGATLRDTRHESTFRPTLGNKLNGWFAVGNLSEAHSLIAVESPIDALSYYTLYAGRNERISVASCSGSFVPQELMHLAYERRQRFVVALDNDAAGERGWLRAQQDTADWTGFKIDGDKPRLKDWNSELMAMRQMKQKQSAKQSPTHRLSHA